ncbi:MAG: hypothetical protein ACR2OF_00060 [Hyphomicrobium sp.]
MGDHDWNETIQKHIAPNPTAQPAAVEPTPEDFKRAHELIWDPKFKYVLEKTDPYSDVEALIAGALAEARQRENEACAQIAASEGCVLAVRAIRARQGGQSDG